MAEEKKNLGGRPSKYREEYCRQIIEYFDVPAVDEEGNAADPRFLTAFARSIGTSKDVLLDWCKKHERFATAYRQAKELQKEMIVSNAIQSRYNSGFAYRTLCNIQDWRDKSDVEQTLNLPPGLKVSFEKPKGD